MKRIALPVLVSMMACGSLAQQILPTMPGYARYSTMPAKLSQAIKIARLSVSWNPDGKAFFYTDGGKRYKFDISSKSAIESDEVANTGPAVRGQGGFGRGQQPGELDSPNGKWKIRYRARNVLLVNNQTKQVTAITSDATDSNRWDYGSVTWTYNEELNQHLPFWWSPDSTKVAFYRFDESKIPDYYLTSGATGFKNGLVVEPYPKAGAENAVTEVFVYDLNTKLTTALDVRDGQPFSNDCIGHYIYDLSWEDDKEIRLLRANRRQNRIEWCSANPVTGKVTPIISETNPDGWCDTHPGRRFLKDGKTLIWTSERNGFRNLYWYDRSGKLLSTITSHQFEVEAILLIDEAKKLLWYTARGGDTPHKLQLFRSKLDGSGSTCLTDKSLNHSIQLSPTGEYFIDTADLVNRAPSVRLVGPDGKIVKVLSDSNLAEYKALGGSVPERIAYRSADGEYPLYGRLYKPSNFDPGKKYPVLVSVYNGPGSTGFGEGFRAGDSTAELGFLLFSPESRGGDNRGRAFRNEAYLKLGVTEIDDIAKGVEAIGKLSYVDASRIGIFGTSYGGYSSIMCLLRYPKLFQAAVASSSVTDWRHYDTIYTERYMWIPQENLAGYEAGSAITYAKDLKGALMLYYGTLDDNVHPANTMQLIRALQRERKSFDVQVSPDAGHSGINQQRMLEFFIEKLVLRR